MGYQKSIEANGLVVKEFKEFGSYQGTWIALLEDGRFIEGSYGSCSGCDAYEAEFGYNEKPELYEGKYYKNNRTWDDDSLSTVSEYEKDLLVYEQKLKDFGMGYINSAEPKELILARYQKRASDEDAWYDDKEIYEWLLTL